MFLLKAQMFNVFKMTSVMMHQDELMQLHTDILITH